MFRAGRLAIIAEGEFGVLTSKTAACIVRYQPERVVCVIDSTKSGRTAGDVLGYGGRIPIVASVQDAVPLAPDTLLIGIAPRGGSLPPQWRQTLMTAIDRGLNIISGLHTMLRDDPEIANLAAYRGVRIWDIREPVLPDGVSQGALRDKDGLVILTVASDSRSGKMTVAYELAEWLTGKGIDARFVATGQTGILLSGWGVVVDRVPGDFMSRVVEDLTVEALASSRVAVVEGQGSLVHPGYSGVALSIMHGCYPDAMILCHQPTRREIRGYNIKIPALGDLIRMHEDVMGPVVPSKVIAIALNTFDLDEAEALAAVDTVEDETGLPATDIVRWGCERISGAVEGLL
jgi:uncharacterized NAD-dependent epimerase/dehydratase family protein